MKYTHFMQWQTLTSWSDKHSLHAVLHQHCTQCYSNAALGKIPLLHKARHSCRIRQDTLAASGKIPLLHQARHPCCIRQDTLASSGKISYPNAGMLYLHIQHWDPSFVIQHYLPPATFSTILLFSTQTVAGQKKVDSTLWRNPYYYYYYNIKPILMNDEEPATFPSRFVTDHFVCQSTRDRAMAWSKPRWPLSR